jgi:hypothetical protein
MMHYGLETNYQVFTIAEYSRHANFNPIGLQNEYFIMDGPHVHSEGALIN